jgi:hypothetical protein
MGRINLSVEEEKMLEPILHKLSEQAKRVLTLDSLVEIWKNFVHEVEEGYPGSIYDYTNDLSTRDILQIIIDQCSSPIREKILSVISNWDSQFIKATWELDRPLLPSKKDKNQKWWWFRVPTKPGYELGNDLKLEGI